MGLVVKVIVLVRIVPLAKRGAIFQILHGGRERTVEVYRERRGFAIEVSELQIDGQPLTVRLLTAQLWHLMNKIVQIHDDGVQAGDVLASNLLGSGVDVHRNGAKRCKHRHADK